VKAGSDAGCLHHVLRGRALLTLHELELDAVALGKRLEALALNRRMVDEYVALAIVANDEAEALLVAEPLHGS